MKNIAIKKIFLSRELKILLGSSILSLSLSSCFTQESSSSSSAGSTVSDDTPVKWNSTSLSGGMNVKISNEILSSFTEGDNDSNGLNPLEQMYDQWNNSTSAETFFDIPALSTTNLNYSDLGDYRDSEMGVYKSYSWFSDVDSSVLAVTQYYGYLKNSGTSDQYIEMSHADIIMNYKDYSFSTSTASSVSYDFHSVVLHELGHFLGLGHTTSYSINSVMLPSLSITSSNRSISSYDKASIVELYGTSSSSTLSAQSSVKSASSAVLSASTPVQKSLPESARKISDAGEIHGLIELRADGECTHYINGENTHRHYVNVLHNGLK